MNFKCVPLLMTTPAPSGFMSFEMAFVIMGHKFVSSDFYKIPNRLSITKYVFCLTSMFQNMQCQLCQNRYPNFEYKLCCEILGCTF